MIDVQKLTRKFGEFVAVHDISFQVERAARNHRDPGTARRRVRGPLPDRHCECSYRECQLLHHRAQTHKQTDPMRQATPNYLKVMSFLRFPDQYSQMPIDLNVHH